MKTQFDRNNPFKQLAAAAGRALAFVGKAARVPHVYNTPRRPPHIGHVFVAPAANAGAWDTMLEEIPCSYVMATDGSRLHVALVATAHVPDDAQPYTASLGFEEVVAKVTANSDSRTTILNASYLREASIAGAKYVAITLPEKAGEAVVIAGLSEEGGQMSWAAVASVARVKWEAIPPQLAIPKPETLQEQEQD